MNLDSIKNRTAFGAVLFGGALLGAQLCVETEQFSQKGGWVVDSQFIDLMGSSFLLAHGMGRPVVDATTEIDVPEAGAYNVYAYTRNWTAPWSAHAAHCDLSRSSRAMVSIECFTSITFALCVIDCEYIEGL